MNRWQWFQLVSFQIIWLTAVLGGNQWLSVSIFILLLHFIFSPNRYTDFKILSLALIGIAVDGGLTLMGFYEFNQPPYWLAVLWLGFSLNFGYSLIYLRRLRTHYRVVLGAGAGCYAYLASWKLGAVDLPLGVLVSAVVIAAFWAVLLPVLVVADQKIRGVH